MNVCARLYSAIIFCAFSGLLIPYIGKAQTPRKYSVFKDGKAFVYAQDSVKSQNGKTILQLPPEALFGTLWLSGASSPITAVRSVTGGLGEKRNFNGLREMLSYNLGKKVRLILAYQEPLEATLSSVMNDFAVFRTKDRWITTSIDKIETIEFLDEPNVQTQENGRQLEIEWQNKTAANHFLSTTYMCNGLGWLPEYQIILSEQDENSATIKLNAKLVNDAEEIKNAEVNFVAGAPDFKFNVTGDPLNSDDDLQQILASLQPEENESQSYKLFYNSTSGSYNTTSKPDATGMQQFTASGEGAEDLYFYTIKNVNLPKGGRASFPVLDAKVPVKHIYTIEVGAAIEVFYPLQFRKSEAKNTVYHILELNNTTGRPWTSGSAFVVKETSENTRPLAQNNMPYAPGSGKTRIQLAAAPEIVVSDSEKETSREPLLNPKDDRNMVTVMVDGEIAVNNYKDKEITLEVKRTITGDLLKSNINWKVSKKANIETRLNPVNEVVWEVTIKPGESKVIQYKYKVSAEK